MVVIRDFNGLLIPSALPILVTVGTEVEVIQHKGNFATVYVNGNLVRVEPQDLDAIGLVSEKPIIRSPVKVANKADNIAGTINLDLVWQALRECYDPEIPVNIVDLGLVYACKFINNKVIVTMTLTAPMCGMGPVLITDIKNRLLELYNVAEVEVEMVFDPPWTQDRLSDAAKIELGLI